MPHQNLWLKATDSTVKPCDDLKLGAAQPPAEETGRPLHRRSAHDARGDCHVEGNPGSGFYEGGETGQENGMKTFGASLIH